MIFIQNWDCMLYTIFCVHYKTDWVPYYIVYVVSIISTYLSKYVLKWVDPFFDFLNTALIGYILVIEEFGPTKHKAMNYLAYFILAWREDSMKDMKLQ